MKIKTVNILRTIWSAPEEIISFDNSTEAEVEFKKLVLSFDKDVDEEDMNNFLDEGYFEDFEGNAVFLIHS